MKRTLRFVAERNRRDRVFALRSRLVLRFRCLVPLVTVALAASLACGSTSPPTTTAPLAGAVDHPARDHGYAMDGVLRMNHVQVKATHNSYHVETPGNSLAEWHYTHAPLDVQLESQGVRGIELDTRYVADTDRFEVFHIPALDEQTTCRAFADCLKVVRAWSDAHPHHAPILVHVEPKDVPPEDAEPYFEKMHAEILGAWPRERIIAPDDVKGDAPTLRDAVTTRGWPTLGQARGTILFYVDNLDVWRAPYTRGGASLANRLMFVSSAEADPLAAVIILNDPTERARIDAAARAGFIVRTRADEAGLPEQRAAALATGAQLLSSDFPTMFPIPEGTPARCNPVTAPAGCSPAAVEDPAHLR